MMKAENRRTAAYQERARSLRALGFANYKDYLRSEMWAQIRSAVLNDAACAGGCGKPPTQVHHGRYRQKDLDGSSFANLYPVCGGCHFTSEFRRADHHKLSPKQATQKLKQRATRNGRPFKTRLQSPAERSASRLNDQRQADDARLAAESLADYKRRCALWKPKR